MHEEHGFGARRHLLQEFEPKFQAIFQGGPPQPARNSSVEAVYEWEQKLMTREKQSRDTITDTIKISTLTTYFVNADLQKHPTVQSGRLPSFDDAREEAVDFLRSKSAWVDDPMDSPPSRQQTAKCECLTAEKLDTARLPSACLGQGSQEHHAWLTRWQTR